MDTILYPIDIECPQSGCNPAEAAAELAQSDPSQIGQQTQEHSGDRSAVPTLPSTSSAQQVQALAGLSAYLSAKQNSQPVERSPASTQDHLQAVQRIGCSASCLHCSRHEDRQQVLVSEPSDRTRRRLSMLGLWRTRGETVDTNNHSANSTRVGQLPELNQQTPSRIQRPLALTMDLYIPPLAPSRAMLASGSHTASLASATDRPQAASVEISQRRLWQNLVMPLVLACVIFLAAIWTRQISHALVNDTLVMVLVLITVFVLMSALAFWLAQDHCTAELDAGSAAALTAADHAHQQHPHYQRLVTANSAGSAVAFCPIHAHLALGGLVDEMVAKCCGVSVIDCRPPDYFSALANSQPVRLYPSYSSDKQSTWSGHADGDHTEGGADADQELQLSLSNSLPAYHELVHYRRPSLSSPASSDCPPASVVSNASNELKQNHCLGSCTIDLPSNSPAGAQSQHRRLDHR